MQIGAIFPSLEIGSDPSAIQDYAQAVEALGYQHLLIVEHILGFARGDFIGSFGPMTHETPFHEPLVLLGFMAGCTQRIEFVTGVLVLPMRETILVAKQAAEVDILSRGRLRLGIGVGWIPPEFAALNQEYATRGARSVEQIAIMRALWTEQSVTFHGRWHHLEAAGIAPKPVQQPIPIWLGGGSEQTLRRAARLADGWLPIGAPNEIAQAKIGRLRGYLAEAGRAEAAFGIHALPLVSAAAEPVWLAQVSGWRAIGATHLSVHTMRSGLSSPQSHIERLRHIRDVLSSEGII